MKLTARRGDVITAETWHHIRRSWNNENNC